MQSIVTSLISNNHIEAANIIRMCLKIFYSATAYQLPNIDPGSPVDISFWVSAIGALFEKRLPEASEGVEPLGQPLDVDERRQWPWWKVFNI